jgi:hypothetical protein
MSLLIQGLAAGLIIPSAVALGLASLPMLGDALGLRRSAARCRQRIEVTIRIGRLVHELQKERGLSVAALARRDGSALGEQRQAGSSAETALRVALGEAGVEGGLALEGVRGLDALRRQIDSYEVAGPDVVRAFSEVIALLLTLSSDMVRGAARGRLIGLAMAAVNLMAAKEMAGQERALVSNALGAGALDEGLRRRLVQVIGGQDIYLGLYRDLAGDAATSALDGDLTPLDPPVLAVRKALLDEDRVPSMTVAQWFALATARIDVLKTHEDRLAEMLLDATARLEGLARRRPWAISLLATASASVLLVLLLLPQSI